MVLFALSGPVFNRLMLMTYFCPQSKKKASAFADAPACRKSLFFKKSACSQSLTPNPFPVVKGCACFVGSASCRASGHTRPASLPGLYYWGCRPHQARMLAVSHTKPLHDAVAQMADDLYGGSAPATPFLNKQEVYRQTEASAFADAPIFNLTLLYFCVLAVTTAE